MSRFSIPILLGLVACGGGPKKQADQPILPPDHTPAITKQEPAPPAKPVEAEKPAPPMQPADLAIALGETSVKLVSPGKGALARLAFAPKSDARQHVEVAIDFRARQDVSGDPKQSQDDVSPTMILAGDATAKSAASGADFVLAISEAHAKDKAGSKLPAAKLEPALSSLVGMTMSGTVAAAGTSSELKLHIEKPDAMTSSALQLVGLAWPEWVPFPAEKIGVGAKWEATAKTLIAGKLAVTRVTQYEVTAHKGAAWTVKATSKVTGADQDLDGTKATNIAGTGSGQLTIIDGTIYPISMTKGETHFTVDAGDKKLAISLETAATITVK